MTRNYSKKTHRYAVGGIVPQETDRSLKDELKALRERDISERNEDAERHGRKPPGRPEEYELKPKLDRESDIPPDFDVSPENYLSPDEQDI
jgi:hypothetical protein